MSMVYEMRIMPEPPLEPRESRCLIGGCGHEIEPGEKCYLDFENGVICRDCAEEIAKELSMDEILSFLGIAHGDYIPGEDIEWEV